MQYPTITNSGKEKKKEPIQMKISMQFNKSDPNSMQLGC